MVLAVYSDASYLSKSKARSRVGGYFFMSSDVPIPPDGNGAVLTVAQIIKAVMSPAAEAELAALYINARKAVYIRKILTKMSQPQLRTPIQTDNSTAAGIVNNTILPKAMKAMDMCFHWLQYRAAQDMFRFFWQPRPNDRGDYPNKHHVGTHHKNLRPKHLTPQTYLDELRARLLNGDEGVLVQ